MTCQAPKATIKVDHMTNFLYTKSVKVIYETWCKEQTESVSHVLYVAVLIHADIQTCEVHNIHKDM